MTTTTSEQDTHLSVLEDLATKLQKTQSNLKKCPRARLTDGYIKARLECLEDCWNSFNKVHLDLSKSTSREQRGILPYFIKEEYYKYEDVYLNTKADLLDYLNKQGNLTHKESEGTSNILSGVKLPRITLPTFSGKYEEFPTYEDLFTTLVHNSNTLTNVQKLHYLKSSLTGEAEALLRTIQITDNNYTQAWNLLRSRYGNKRIIITSLLKRLFNQKKVMTQSAANLKSLLDITAECLNGLNNIGLATKSWDPIIVFLVVQKLDIQTHKEWEERAYNAQADDFPGWSQLQSFLESKFRTLELITSTSRDRNNSQLKSFHSTSKEVKPSHLPNAHRHQNTCAYCGGDHFIYRCKDFLKLTVEERHNFALKEKLCFNCLMYNHNVLGCRQQSSCRICQRKHHSLLHLERRQHNSELNTTATTNPEATTTQISAHMAKEHFGHRVILATALVEVTSRTGETHTLRALIDQGSEASFVTARVVDLLGLPRKKINGIVSGVGEESKVIIKQMAEFELKSRYQPSFSVIINAYVLKSITNLLPSKNVNVHWPQLSELELADPNFGIPGRIDILLGANIFCKIIDSGLLRGPDDLIAQCTSLGWILSGQKSTTHNEHPSYISMHVTSTSTPDNDMLKKLWEIDNELYNKRKILTEEEKRCEEVYKATTVRDNSGRYVVHLPLKNTIKETIKLCGETKQQATKRFELLERKFEKDSKFKEEYKKVINEYMEMGHMVPTTKTEDQGIYLPHHAVVREDKETTKVRVVFDASAKGVQGKSLNDLMMVGPVLQPDLRSLIIQWRTYKICIVGDIVKMYRMVKVTQEHTDLQRIVWRDDPNDELKSYNLTTVTFGTAAAPYLAVRTLNQLADDESERFLEAASVIKQGFYMDDLMVGHETEEKAKQLCDDIKTVLEAGGFETQKWSSNSDKVLKHLVGKQSNDKDKIEIKLDKIIKILGLTWDRKDDMFKIITNLPELKIPVTKRSVLSDVARLFDPFGWLAPVVIIGKIMIQRLWSCNVQWDEELPQNILDDWLQYREGLVKLQGIKIPRWFKTTVNNNKNVELHGFSDASVQAYAAVAYLRVIHEDEVHVSLIASRTKVAPLKQISVPKLELCAAALLAELICDMAELLDIPKDKIFAWTDSMVVLSWLQSEPNRWRTFVANRVSDITRVVDYNKWHHVKSADNPADIATRGVQSQELQDQSIWWTGPIWLKERHIQEFTVDVPQTELEQKKTFNIQHVQEVPVIWERFSSFIKLKKVLAYCRRFLIKSKPKEQLVTREELQYIENKCLQYYQEEVYSTEIQSLKKEGKVPKKSSLITFTPYLDDFGLLRVGGRLNNAANLSIDIKHPIIIPEKTHITKLIIQEAHLKTLHGGILQTMTYIRSKYWIINMKSAVKKFIHKCTICIREKARTSQQLMGQLPAPRVNPARAFSKSGVDYAGPVQIRTSKGRGYTGTKGYICLFICMSTKAIHLECVTDLTSQAFIAAFRRFVARRGHCEQLWSDNGTNFVGAARELKHMFEAGKNNVAKEIAELLINDGTTWHFIPPRAPNFGGLWEAGVKSAKRHLTKINKETRLTYEEMATLLAQVEACLNSRPLCKLDDTTETLTPLTPGHFLVGEPLIGIPGDKVWTTNTNLLSRWQFIQGRTQLFWKKWQTDYLHTLQQRYKWKDVVAAPSVGDVVLIKETDLPPCKWLLGVILQLHPGADKLVRVVTVRCKGNLIIKRPLSNLIFLPYKPEN